jgi:hypothetical protein
MKRTDKAQNKLTFKKKTEECWWWGNLYKSNKVNNVWFEIEQQSDKNLEVTVLAFVYPISPLRPIYIGRSVSEAHKACNHHLSNMLHT